MAASAETVVRAWFDEVWNQGREASIDRLMAAEALIHDLPHAGGRSVRGPSGFKPFYRKFHTAFPDLRITVEHCVTQGDMVATRCRVTGNASGKPVEFWGMTLTMVRNGQIVEGWNAFDFLSFYQQLGLMPRLPT